MGSYTQALFGVACPTATNCFATGDGGVVLATTDGGGTWSPQSAPTASRLTSIACPNASTCYAVGEGGTTVATTDGGGTWNIQLPYGTLNWLYGIVCPTSSTCLSVGHGDSPSDAGMLATTDGGSTWVRQDLAGWDEGALGGIACPTSSRCFAAGADGTVLAGSLTSAVPSTATLDHLALSPASSTITAGGSQAYTAQGLDASSNSLGDVTSATTFSISGGGSCAGVSCTATVPGTYTVTGTDGTATGTATLQVTTTAPNDWPQFRDGPAHTGYNAAETTLSPSDVADLGVKWTAAIGDATYSSATVADGVVYIGAQDGTVDGRLYAFAVDCASGGGTCTPLWTAVTSLGIQASPAVADGVVYVASGTTGHLYAFPVGCRSDGGTCSPIWTADIGDTRSSPTVADGVVYITSYGTGDLYAFAVGCASGGGTCSPLWTAYIGYSTRSSAAVSDGVVYVGSFDGDLYAFPVGCRSDGGACSPIWTGATGSYLNSSPAVSGGVVYIGSEDGNLYAFAVGCASGGGTCAPLWRGPTGIGINSSPAVSGGVVYIGSEDGNLYAFAVGCASGGGTCTPLWTGAISGEGFHTIWPSPAVANGVVYIGGLDSNLYAFAVGCASGGGTCMPIWTADVGGAGSSPTIANGVVYIGSDDGKLYAFSGPNYVAVVTGTIAQSPDAAGWFNTPVTVDWTATDPYATVTTPSPTTISTEGADQTATSGQSCDPSGNCATGAVSGINIDMTPPTVSVTGATSGAVYTGGQAPTPGCATSDQLSGVATAATLAVSSSGSSYTATCSGAADNAGNTAAPVSVAYTVLPVGWTTVSVVDSGGSPLAGVPVAFRSSSGAVTNLTTGQGGTAATALAPGQYTVTATYANGYQSQSLTVTANGPNTVGFATVAVTVQVNDPSSSDLASASVAHAGNTGTFGPKTPVSASGQVVFQALPGTSSFTAYVAGGYQTQTVTVSASGTNTVTFSTVAVTVQVNDPSSSDLASASVAHAGNTGTFGPKTPVSASGQVVFQALPGTSSFTAYVAGGYQSQTVTVSASGTNTVTFSTVAVTVTVLKNGSPLATATVAHAGNTGTFGPKTPVSSSGQVVFQVLPGTSYFTAWDGSAYSTVQLNVTGATSTSISVA
jgi:outer membrane protein assembly factor BamB